MCDKTVDDSIAVCYNKNLYTVLYAGDGLLFFDEDTGDITFRWNEMGIFSVSHYYINLDYLFDEDDPHTIILIRLLAS